MGTVRKHPSIIKHIRKVHNGITSWKKVHHTRRRTCRTLVSMAQDVSMDFGSKLARLRSERAYRSMPVATRREVPSPASVTARKRNVSASAAVSSLGPHPAHSRAAPGALFADDRCCSNARALGGWRLWWMGGDSGWWSSCEPPSEWAAWPPSSLLCALSSQPPAACAGRGAHLVMCLFRVQPGRNCRSQCGHRTRPWAKGSMGGLHWECYPLQWLFVPKSTFWSGLKAGYIIPNRRPRPTKRRYNFF